MIDTKDMRAEVERDLEKMTQAERDHSWPMAERVRKCLGEIETLRKPSPMAGLFDVDAAREELARIDALWAECFRSWDDAAVVDALRALLDRALDALSAGWEPVAITDEMAEEAAQEYRDAENRWFHSELRARSDDSQRQERKDRFCARAVLEYAASLGGVAPAPVVGGAIATQGKRPTDPGDGRPWDEWASIGRSKGVAPAPPVAITDDVVREASAAAACSSGSLTRAVLEWAAARGMVAQVAKARAFKLYGALPQLPILASCERDGLTEAETIRALAEHVETLSTDLRRCVEESRAPVDTGAAKRLVKYRCAAPAMMGDVNNWSPKEKATAVEDIAHAMLAAERPVSQ